MTQRILFDNIIDTINNYLEYKYKGGIANEQKLHDECQRCSQRVRRFQGTCIQDDPKAQRGVRSIRLYRGIGQNPKSFLGKEVLRISEHYAASIERR